MNFRALVLFSAAASTLPLASYASPIAPFGVASAYNLTALGTVDSHGNTVIAGTVSSGSDVGGRVAASGAVTNLGTMGGSAIGNATLDPFGSLANGYLLVANGGLNTQSLNINSAGNVYTSVAIPSGNHVNFNHGGSVITGNPSAIPPVTSPIDFNSLRTSLDAETAFLGALNPTTTNVGTNRLTTNTDINKISPSYFVLNGTSSTLNIFNITAAQLNDTNHPLDIIAPASSTIIINVTNPNGTTYDVETDIYRSFTATGTPKQINGDDATNDKLLFNFVGATSVNLGHQFSASLLAPFANLTGNGQMDGNFIAASIAVNGEVHNVEFIGSLPPMTPAVPEPATLALVGTGLMSVAGATRRKKRELLGK